VTKTTQTKRNQKYRDKVKLWFANYREAQACGICGENHTACISFHHRDPSTKSYAVAEMPNRGCSIAKIIEEIEKCDVLCHNCHAKVHFEEAVRPFKARIFGEVS
jgi:hypothetical protein